MTHPTPAWLVLENGTLFEGQAIGQLGDTIGELVFNTSMTGYQEVLTDPSYAGQIVMMTTPEIGNYGVNFKDYESEKIHAAGFVVKHLSPMMSSWRAQLPLEDFMIHHHLVGIQGIDTRAITRIVRQFGAMKAGILADLNQKDAFLQRVKTQPSLSDLDLVGQVTTQQVTVLQSPHAPIAGKPRLHRMVVVDFGAKKSILDYLLLFVDELVILPAHSAFETVASYQPDAVLLSNGPGDPAVLHGIIAMAKDLVSSQIPTFGICLGHQILALACGANVQKMKFGHHGGNHPVKDLELDTIMITSQNHGYAVEFEAFPEDTLKVTHVNLNDGSIEGFRHLHAPVMSVQFHPEANPGPHDASYLFEQFIQQACRQKAQ